MTAGVHKLTGHRGRKRRIVKYGGHAPGWYVWDHIEEPPFLSFVGRYRTRAGARAERESDRVAPGATTSLPPKGQDE